MCKASTESTSESSQEIGTMKQFEIGWKLNDILTPSTRETHVPIWASFPYPEKPV